VLPAGPAAQPQGPPFHEVRPQASRCASLATATPGPLLGGFHEALTFMQQRRRRGHVCQVWVVAQGMPQGAKRRGHIPAQAFSTHKHLLPALIKGKRSMLGGIHRLAHRRLCILGGTHQQVSAGCCFKNACLPQFTRADHTPARPHLRQRMHDPTPETS